MIIISSMCSGVKAGTAVSSMSSMFTLYFFLMKFMVGEDVFAPVLGSVALGILFRGLITLIWTSQLWYPLQYLNLENRAHHVLKGVAISTFGLVMIVTAVLRYARLFLCFKFTKRGPRMRAVGEKPLPASQSGVDLHRYYALSWGIAVFSAGLAGMIQACDSDIDPNMFIIGLEASLSFPWGVWIA